VFPLLANIFLWLSMAYTITHVEDYDNSREKLAGVFSAIFLGLLLVSTLILVSLRCFLKTGWNRGSDLFESKFKQTRL
jgi:hypothetical protein